MATQNGVMVASVAATNDPLGRGRVQVRFPGKPQGNEWARVSSPIGATSSVPSGLRVDDEVLVAFENGNPRAPFIIGLLLDGRQSPPDTAGTEAVHLPTGSVLRPIVADATQMSPCASAADLQRQAAPWLASMECVLKILALLKPLIDVVENLPAPPPAAFQAFSKAAADLRPCLSLATSAQATPLAHDLICLSLRSLQCLVDKSASSAQVTSTAVGIQGVLDLAQPFFGAIGIAPIHLAATTNPAALAGDIQTLTSVANSLGGCTP